MLKALELLSNKLYLNIDKYGLSSYETAKTTKEIDDISTKFLKREKKFANNNFMYNQYKISYQKLKKLSGEFNENITIEAWNRYAKENDYLNAESIKYISGLNWNELKLKMKIENNINS